MPASEIAKLASQHERYRAGGISLMPSENSASKEVLSLLSSDLSNRYSLVFDEKLHGCHVHNAYGGAKFTDAIERRTDELACEVFGCEHATVQPLSGHIAGMVMLLSVCKRGDLMLTVDAKHGGYDGYAPGYMPEMFGIRSEPLPFDEARGTLDSKASAELIIARRPKLVLVGASFFPFPYDLKPLAGACREVGATLGYDGSHVLGLIAGGQFQQPLKEGADILTGSTHKSFFGPQGGLVLCNDDELFQRARKNLTWRTMDNAHWNRIAGLGQALLEMNEFGKPYAKQVIANSRALAVALDKRGLPIRFKKCGFTASHQLLLDTAAIESKFGLTPSAFSDKLDASGLIVDAVGRLGTSEATRWGAKERDMELIAGLIMRALDGENVKKEVQALRGKMKMEYCF